MNRIKGLNRYQQMILLVLAVMMVAFTVLYVMVFSRAGFAYADHILIPGDENGTITYSGTIRGREAVFTVTRDQTVTFRHGEKIYGPYTAKEDPTAVPQDSDLARFMTGVEILEGDQVYFRGGVFRTGEDLVLINENGRYANIYVSYSQGDGTVMDLDGNAVGEMEPPAATILELLDGPVLTRKGEWAAWLCGAFFCIATAVSILFTDELFRWHISFRVQDPEAAEPSDWEIAGRYISWTVLPVMALAVFVIGLL